MPAHCFFVVSYTPETAYCVDKVCEELTEAVRGERLIVTAPEGIIVEEFEVGVREEWESEP